MAENVEIDEEGEGQNHVAPIAVIIGGSENDSIWDLFYRIEIIFLRVIVEVIKIVFIKVPEFLILFIKDWYPFR